MRRDEEVSKTRKILGQLQKLSCNKACAECGGKQPTWASTNLGVFVCIRCSGIHRQMGTHISKVKSATLDIWNLSLVKHFQAQGGNEKVNLKWEAKMPKSCKPNANSDNHVIERFIRDKYERRMWYSAKGKKKKTRKNSSSSDVSSEDSSDSESTGSSSSKREVKKKKKSPPKKTKKKSKPKIKSPKAIKPPSKALKTAAAPEPVPDLLDLSALPDESKAKKKNSFDASSFVDDLLATPAAPAPTGGEMKEQDFFTPRAAATGQSPPNSGGAPKTTDDIMKIFSNKGSAQKSDPFKPMMPAAPNPMNPMMMAAPPPAMQPNIMYQQPMAAMPYPGQHMPMANAYQQPRPAYQQPRPAYGQPMGMPPNPQQMNPNIFTQVNPQAQTRYLGVGPNRPTGFRQNPPSGFNPAPMNAAFDSLMSGGKPKKDNEKSAPVWSASAPKKKSNGGLNIDLDKWMS